MTDILANQHVKSRRPRSGANYSGLRYSQKIISFNPNENQFYQSVHGRFVSRHQQKYFHSSKAQHTAHFNVALSLFDATFIANIFIFLAIIYFIYVHSLGLTSFIINSESQPLPSGLYSELAFSGGSGSSYGLGGLSGPSQGTLGEDLRPSAPVEIEPSQFESLELDVYTIEAGDTLSGIADRFDLAMDTIISFNQIESARRIQIGQSFQIPNRDGLLHIVKEGESLLSISNEYDSEFNAILDSNSLFSEEIVPGQALFIPNAQLDRITLGLILGELFIYPVYGTFTSGFGYRSDPFTGERRFHNGIDIANVRGTNIRAAMDGRVVYVDAIGSTNYGKYVIMQHAGGFQSLYAHFHDISVQRGQYIYQGGVLGGMGNTGRSTGNHLHFSIIRNGSFVDPLAYLQ